MFYVNRFFLFLYSLMFCKCSLKFCTFLYIHDNRLEVGIQILTAHMSERDSLLVSKYWRLESKFCSYKGVKGMKICTHNGEKKFELEQ